MLHQPTAIYRQAGQTPPLRSPLVYHLSHYSPGVLRAPAQAQEVPRLLGEGSPLSSCWPAQWPPIPCISDSQTERWEGQHH